MPARRPFKRYPAARRSRRRTTKRLIVAAIHRARETRNDHQRRTSCRDQALLQALETAGPARRRGHGDRCHETLRPGSRRRGVAFLLQLASFQRGRHFPVRTVAFCTRRRSASTIPLSLIGSSNFDIRSFALNFRNQHDLLRRTVSPPSCDWNTRTIFKTRNRLTMAEMARTGRNGGSWGKTWRGCLVRYCEEEAERQQAGGRNE